MPTASNVIPMPRRRGCTPSAPNAVDDRVDGAQTERALAMIKEALDGGRTIRVPALKVSILRALAGFYGHRLTVEFDFPNQMYSVSLLDGGR